MFYKGNLVLRHKTLPSLEITLIFKPDEQSVDKQLDIYGKLMFSRAEAGTCKAWGGHLSAFDQLCLQETLGKLPVSLLRMCQSSTDLSDFDENMHAIVQRACEKCAEVEKETLLTSASLEIDDKYVKPRKPQSLSLTCKLTLHLFHSDWSTSHSVITTIQMISNVSST